MSILSLAHTVITKLFNYAVINMDYPDDEIKWLGGKLGPRGYRCVQGFCGKT